MSAVFSSLGGTTTPSPYQGPMPGFGGATSWGPGGFHPTGNPMPDTGSKIWSGGAKPPSPDGAGFDQMPGGVDLSKLFGPTQQPQQNQQYFQQMHKGMDSLNDALQHIEQMQMPGMQYGGGIATHGGQFGGKFGNLTSGIGGSGISAMM